MKFDGNGINFLDGRWTLVYQTVTWLGIHAGERDSERDNNQGAPAGYGRAPTSGWWGSLRMARALVQLLPFEMAILGLFEFAFLFALIFVMLTAGGHGILLESTDLPRDCLVLAAMLAVTIAGTAATIGLYRPEVCLDRRRFLICGTLAALLAFPATRPAYRR